MSNKSLRLSEKWFRRGLWLLSLIFAIFLMGLGSLVVNDLPRVESVQSRSNYQDRGAVEPLESARSALVTRIDAIVKDKQTLRLDADNAANEYRQAHDTYQNWLSSRSTTQQASQNPEVIQRTKDLDALKAKQLEFERQLAAVERSKLDLERQRNNIDEQLGELNASADKLLNAALRKQELRIFLYRLMVTLPLILIAGWLFAKKRKGQYWPFVWGFIFFALYTFFVELVPYLPSYGGYVRSIVGIVVTIVIGHYSIKSMQSYLARQKAQEAEPDNQRRKSLQYDTVLMRLSKKVCPGCERPIDVEKPELNHCPHCGISVFNNCGSCQARKNAFSPFCYSCGAQTQVVL